MYKYLCQSVTERQFSVPSVTLLNAQNLRIQTTTNAFRNKTELQAVLVTEVYTHEFTATRAPRKLWDSIPWRRVHKTAKHYKTGTSRPQIFVLALHHHASETSN